MAGLVRFRSILFFDFASVSVQRSTGLGRIPKRLARATVLAAAAPRAAASTSYQLPAVGSVVSFGGGGGRRAAACFRSKRSRDDRSSWTSSRSCCARSRASSTVWRPRSEVSRRVDMSFASSALARASCQLAAVAMCCGSSAVISRSSRSCEDWASSQCSRSREDWAGSRSRRIVIASSHPRKRASSSHWRCPACEDLGVVMAAGSSASAW